MGKEPCFYNGEGYGQYALEHYGYNQAVRIGDRVEISGQGKPQHLLAKIRSDLIMCMLNLCPGAWDPTSSPPTFPYPTDAQKQISQAFRNIDFVLKSAGVKGGIFQVYKIRSYHPNLELNHMKWVREELERWWPDEKIVKRPIWTAVGIEKLAFPEMLVEIEAVAYDPNE